MGRLSAGSARQGANRVPMRWFPFRRRGPDRGAELTQQASALAELANAVSASLASLREREQAVEARAAWVEQSFARDAQALDERRDALRVLGEELQAREGALAAA